MGSKKRKLSESFYEIEEEVSKLCTKKRFKQGFPETRHDHFSAAVHHSMLHGNPSGAVHNMSLSYGQQQSIQQLQQQASDQSQQQFGAVSPVMPDDQVKSFFSFFNKLTNCQVLYFNNQESRWA